MSPDETDALSTPATPSRRSVMTGAGLTALAAITIPGVADADVVDSASAVASGQAMPVGDIPGWKQVIAEDFGDDVPVGGFAGSPFVYGELATDCAAYDTYGHRLGVYGTCPVGGALYSPEKTISTYGSMLDLHLHVDESGTPVCAAAYPVRPGSNSNSHQYARWSYRMRTSQVTSRNWACVSELWPAVDAEWPASGEVNWPEGAIDMDQPPLTPIHGFYHPRGTRTIAEFQNQQSFVQAPGAKWTDWHTYTMEWSAGSVKLLLDGQELFSTTSNVPTTQMRWVTQTGPADSQLGLPTGSAHVQIDWVVAYDPA